MLAQLVAADPGHLTALRNWLDTPPAAVQSAEQRRAWLEELLAGPRRNENRALILTRLARLALEQGDRAQARARLDEARRLWPECPDTLLFELEMVTPETPSAQRLRAALGAFSVNPMRVELAWEVARLLDESGFADEALGFYTHAMDVHMTIGSGQPLSTDRLLDLARNALARDDVRQAVHYVEQALTANDDGYEAKFWAYWLAVRQGRTELAERFKNALAAEFTAIAEPAQTSVDIVSQAAWFYCVVDPQPDRALMLAEDAARRAPGDPFATRVLGWAQALSGLADEARATLTPIATRDPHAAIRLAHLLTESGDDADATRLLRELPYIPVLGAARSLYDELGGRAAAAQRLPDIARALAGFDRELLDFHRDSTRFMEATIELEDVSLMPGAPWRAVFSLTNRGGFPITLGPDWMVNPVFLLSFRVRGDREREYPDALVVSVDRDCVIRPGQTIRQRHTIDIGGARRACRLTPQQVQTISLTAILDPRQTVDGRWLPGPTGRTLRPVSFVRSPAGVTPEAWNVHLGVLRGGSSPAQFLVLEVMAQLLGERQRADRGQLSYRPQPVSLERIQAALLGALESESWETRARALDALQVAGLDRAFVTAAESCLEHPHWLVRMMAVRLLARQGKDFADTARRIAEQDADELVRAMAQSYVDRWSQ